MLIFQMRNKKIIIASILLLLQKLIQKPHRRPRRFWVNPRNTKEKRDRYGEQNILEELVKPGQEEDLANYLRMTLKQFLLLRSMVKKS